MDSPGHEAGTRLAPDAPTDLAAPGHGPRLTLYSCPSCGGAMRYAPGRSARARDWRRPLLGARDPIKDSAALRARCSPRVECASCGQGETLPAEDLGTAGRPPATGTDASAEVAEGDRLCPGCGAEPHLSVGQISAACPSCAGSLVREDLAGTGWFRIDGVLPLLVDEATARRRVMERASITRVSPGNRRRYREAPLAMNYLPCLVFDVDTRTEYAGRVVKSRYDSTQKRNKTTERHVSGTLTTPVQVEILTVLPESVLPPGSGNADFEFPIAISAFRPIHLPDDAVALRREYVAGLAAHLPGGDFDAHRREAERLVAATVKREVDRKMGSGTKRMSTFESTTSNLRYRVLLCPAWTGTVTATGGSAHSIWVDGATGVQHVDTPRSVFGIVRALLYLVFVLLGVSAVGAVVLALLAGLANLPGALS